jgi:type II secretory ATPase GspE/PulE/Tfp pilus assembly ATPase PilB-like protein
MFDTTSPAAPGLPPAREPGDGETARLVDAWLHQAVRERASDLHVEPFEDVLTVRLRVDGTLREIARPSASVAVAAISRLKVLADLNIAERRVPQDGRLRLEVDGRSVDLRVSTLPTCHGESVVLRVLDGEASRRGLEELGLPGPVLAGLNAAIARPNGLVLVTGPTGSGKTTTLYGALRALNTPDRKLITVEDPVEYDLEGVMQVGVHPGIGRTFAATLRAMLRQDPDVLLVGEIRDEETARVAVQAALTGHLVLATLHTNDAPGAVARLADMGVERYLIASALAGVLAQRLVRRLCPHCRHARRTSPQELHRASIAGGEAPAICHEAAGCPQCEKIGYKGRLGLHEWLPVTPALRDLIADGAPSFALREAARETGLITLREAGLRAIAAGETSFDEILMHT